MRHLDDRQFARLVNGESDAAAAAHVEACGVCAAEIERLRGFAGNFREAILAAGERAPLAEPARERRAVRSWAPLAAALAGLLFVSLALLHHAPPQPPARAAQHAPKDASDDLLLLEVDADISRPTPEALAPVSLILQARNKQAETHAEKETQ